MTLNEEALIFHRNAMGKIAISSKVPLATRKDLSLAYTPGVAEPCRKIMQDRKLVFEYTSKWNTVAVVSDGTRVLGLGDIGPEAALPVMEGKAILFKEFGSVDAFPICLAEKDLGKLVDIITAIAPSFGGINLEDIESPKCFELETILKKKLDIPVFHDDQHGTAVVALAGLINSLKIVNKTPKEANIVVMGAGAAGSAITKHLINAGCENILVCDKDGILYDEATEALKHRKELVKITNKRKTRGSSMEAARGADVIIGVSVPGSITPKMIQLMAKDPIVFAMANPVPEIYPEEAKKAGARIIATGRSDFPNQLNNLLGFPGIFRGALDAQAYDINDEMKIAASNALASAVGDSLSVVHILPDPLWKGVHLKVAMAVHKAAYASGVARK
ncbi:MAG: NADP-dependent malic enzyme [Candidatus Micrarchaeota archaeon]